MTRHEYDELVLSVFPATRGVAYTFFSAPLAPLDWGVKRIRDKDKNTHSLETVVRLCNALPRKDHAAYIGEWLKVLKGDKRAAFTPATKAGEALAFPPASRIVRDRLPVEQAVFSVRPQLQQHRQEDFDPVSTRPSPMPEKCSDAVSLQQRRPR